MPRRRHGQNRGRPGSHRWRWVTGPYWGAAFTVGGGLAAGTITLVSQRYGASAFDRLGQAGWSSVLLVLGLTLPLAAMFWTFAEPLVALLSNDARTVRLGATYLPLVAPCVPFAGLYLVGSHILIGADDAWTPMVIRADGAVMNVALDALFIFGLGMGVADAALGTVLADVGVTATFAVGLVLGRLPGRGPSPSPSLRRNLRRHPDDARHCDHWCPRCPAEHGVDGRAIPDVRVCCDIQPHGRGRLCHQPTNLGADEHARSGV